jgi:hypothetical protein
LSRKEGIKSAKWIPKTTQMLVLHENSGGKVSLISSQNSLKVCALFNDQETLLAEFTKSPQQKLDSILGPSALMNCISEPQVFEVAFTVQLDTKTLLDKPTSRIEDILVASFEAKKTNSNNFDPTLIFAAITNTYLGKMLLIRFVARFK